MKGNSHTINPKEIDAIKALGFTIKTDMADLYAFIRENFPNLDLLSLLAGIVPIFSQGTTLRIVKRIVSKDKPPRLIIEIENGNLEDERSAWGLRRTFVREDEECILLNDYLQVPTQYRNKGVAKYIYKNFLQQCLNIGVRRCRLFAVREGSLVWAKLRFNAIYPREVKEILALAKSKLQNNQFQAIERIYNNYYKKSPQGQAFPIFKWAELPFMEKVLISCSWHGEVDLHDRQQLVNFISLVSE